MRFCVCLLFRFLTALATSRRSDPIKVSLFFPDHLNISFFFIVTEALCSSLYLFFTEYFAFVWGVLLIGRTGIKFSQCFGPWVFAAKSLVFVDRYRRQFGMTEFACLFWGALLSVFAESIDRDYLWALTADLDHLLLFFVAVCKTASKLFNLFLCCAFHA